MKRPRNGDGSKNLIAKRLIALRKEKNLSQRGLAMQLQLAGIDIDKNVITRIETNKRYVTDVELKAIATFFQVSYEDLLDERITEGENGKST